MATGHVYPFETVDAPRKDGGRAFDDTSGIDAAREKMADMVALSRARRAEARSEIASRIAAARKEGTATANDNLPTSEWSPTIGQPKAANSDVMGEAGQYVLLRTILDAAFNHAATGKGKERHARDLPFDKQPMLETTRLVGPGFPLGQAIKKAGEAAGMIEREEYDAAEAECLGAINYLAGAVAWVREVKEGKVAA
ncbi:MAG: hypothetical protein WBB98_04470 [Xanthobacteraceae bacterium]